MMQGNPVLKLYKARVRKIIGASVSDLKALPTRLLYQYLAYILLDKRSDLLADLVEDVELSTLLCTLAALYGKTSEEYNFLLGTQLGSTLSLLSRVADEKRLLLARNKVEGDLKIGN